jgi:hypothetical protein
VRKPTCLILSGNRTSQVLGRTFPVTDKPGTTTFHAHIVTFDDSQSGSAKRNLEDALLLGLSTFTFPCGAGATFPEEGA